MDTKLEGHELAPGDRVRGVVEVEGGNSEQEVHGIRLEVLTYYKREPEDATITETGTIEHFPVSGQLHIMLNRPDATLLR